MDSRMLANIKSVATGSDSEEPTMTISHELSRLNNGVSLRRVGVGLYELGPVLVHMLTMYRKGILRGRLRGWGSKTLFLTGPLHKLGIN